MLCHTNKHIPNQKECEMKMKDLSRDRMIEWENKKKWEYFSIAIVWTNCELEGKVAIFQTQTEENSKKERKSFGRHSEPKRLKIK